MSIYRKLNDIGIKYFGQAKLFKFGFNFSPMYRRSTAKIVTITEDLKFIKIKLPISWKNRNYMNTIFGGSMFSATDPIYMIQLTMILGKEFVVWDKSSEIFFKRPGKVDLYAEFIFTDEEINTIKERIKTENEIVLEKKVILTDHAKSATYCEVIKRIYIANKSFYKEKQKLRNASVK